MNPICAKCETEMERATSGVIVIYIDANGANYKMYYADLHKCRLCDNKVITGFADNPFWRREDGEEPSYDLSKAFWV